MSWYGDAWNAVESGADRFINGAPNTSQYGKIDPNAFNAPGYDQANKQLGTLAGNYGRTRSAEAAQSAYRPQQQRGLDALWQDAQGNGVGQQLIRQQAQMSADRGAQQQLAMAAGGRPGMGGQAYRNAALNAGNIQSQVGSQASLAGGQQRLASLGAYQQAIGGARGQDESRNQFNAGQQNQFKLGMTQAQLQALQQQQQLRQAQMGGQMGLQQLQQQRYGADMSQPRFGLGGYLINGASQMGAAYMGSQGGGK